MKLKNLKIGLGITGSFCNLKDVKNIIESLHKEEIETIIPIVSNNIQKEVNRFGTPEETISMLKKLTKNEVVDTISKAEPIGPKNLIDLMIIAPCTGNTLAKLNNGISDTPVLMAAKSHLRNDKPLLLGIASNDALGANAKNIGELFNTKNIYFIPFRQDDYDKKPKSLVFDYTKLVEAAEFAMDNKQVQPILL